MQDPKKIHTKKTYLKCRVNGCFKKGDFENGICQKCKTKISKAQRPKERIKSHSEKSYPKAFKEAKAAFQLLRRLQESDETGMVKCVHGSVKHFTKCDGGHYMPAQYKNTCFNPLNVWPQEKAKNMDMNNPLTVFEYRNFLIKKIGLSEVEILEQTYRIPKKYSAFELVEMTKMWVSEINMIKKSKNI